MSDRAVIMMAMRNFSNRELARIILFMPKMAEVFYQNMSMRCADMIRKNVNEVDVIDDCNCNYPVMSGKNLYEYFIEKMKEKAWDKRKAPGTELLPRGCRRKLKNAGSISAYIRITGGSN